MSNPPLQKIEKSIMETLGSKRMSLTDLTNSVNKKLGTEGAPTLLAVYKLIREGMIRFDGKIEFKNVIESAVKSTQKAINHATEQNG